MRFPLKVVLSAVLAKNIVGELAQSSATQKIKNDVDVKYQPDLQQQQQQQKGPAFFQPDINERRDSVVRYVSSSNIEQDSFDNQPSNEVLMNDDQYYPQSSQYQAAYSPSVGYNQGPYEAYNPGEFHVQTGYEGYLVPYPPTEVTPPKTAPESRFNFNPFQALSRGLPNMMRQSGSFLTQAFGYLLSLIGFTVFGGAATTALCTFTPLCTISFSPLLPLVRTSVLKDGIKDIAAPLVGPEKADLLQKAIDTISKIQTDEQSSIAAKTGPVAAETELKDVAKLKEVAPVVADSTTIADSIVSKFEPLKARDESLEPVTQ